MIAGILFLVAIAAMIAAFTGVWPPKSKTEPTVAERWQAQTSATPMVQRASGLKVEKLGAPTKQGEDVVVRLKVTNQVQASAVVTGTATANAATPTAGPANLDSASIRVLFYNVDDNGNQMVIGGTVGSVVDLPYGESREIEVRASGVEGFTDKTQYEAFPETVWPSKQEKQGGTGVPLAMLNPPGPRYT